MRPLFFAVSSSLPVELQRVVHTIKDIDERLVTLKGETKARVDACLAMPSASSRQASADDIDATNKARHEIEKNHADIVQLSKEKVRLAHIAMEMIQYNIGALDKELNPFTQEMKERNEAGFEDDFAVDADTPAAGGALDPMTMAFMSGHDFDLGGGNAPSMQHSHQQQKKSHKKKVPLPPQPGERVAANIGEVSGDPGAQEWIVAVVVAHKPEEGAYEVMDADEESDDGSGQVYHIPEDLIIAMPRSALCREGQNFHPGTVVLAVYPMTTTFYRAVVVQSARKLGGEYGDFLLEFEDDGDADGLPQRPVPYMHVVKHPQYR